MNREKLKEYNTRILPNGTLEMRDPNDNARHRYQYRLIDSRPHRRTLPEHGDYDPPAQWEEMNLSEILATAGTYHPILDYFGYNPMDEIRRRMS